MKNKSRLPFNKQLLTFVFCWFLFSHGLVRAQEYPTKDFTSPMNIPLYLSGVFGECRPTHFHAGMDIKTNQIEGLPVLSIGDGYVSRIKVSAYGYGNALYITHPNGYTSVYGHLKSYSKTIADFVKQKQYEHQSFEIDEYLPLNYLTVKKGEVVAKSGNTGGSGGPHLHFEIRDSLENAINPQFFGIQIVDHLRPEISGLAIIDMNQNRFFCSPYVMNCIGKDGNYKPLKDTILLNSNQLAFAIESKDKMDGSSGTNGIFSENLYIDNMLYFNYTMDKFSFDQSRNVVGYINQDIKESYHRIFQHCFIQANQSFNCFKENINRGIVYLNDNNYHLVKILVSDFQNNTSTLSFYIKNDIGSLAFKQSEKSYQQILYPSKTNLIDASDIKATIPGTALFDITYITYSRMPGGLYSPMIQIGKTTDPLFSAIQVGIKTTNLSVELQSKALLVNKTGGATISCGGKYENGYVMGSTKSFGRFVISIDTTAPILRPINLLNNKIMSKESAIKFLLSDNLSGIESYNAYIDGRWVLLEFDAKSSLIKYNFDIPAELKSHELVIEVTDERKNSRTYNWSFVY